MKKSLLFAAAAVAMLSSCSNDEVLLQDEAPQEAIGFKSFINNSTRAVNETKTNNLPGFQVWGGMAAKGTAATTTSYGAIFNGDAVTKDGTTWTYSPLRYWVPGNSYSFTAIGAYENNPEAWAYTPETTIEAGSFLNNYFGTLTFDQTKSKGKVDLVWTSTKVKEATENMLPVSLTFKHLLSQVNLKFINCFPSDGATIQISNVTVQSATNGTLVLNQYPCTKAAADFVWTYTGDKAYSQSYNFPNGTAISNKFDNSAYQTTEYFTVIPSQTQIQVNFTAILYSGGVVAGTWPHSVTLDLDSDNLNAVFKPGYTYTLVANLNADNIADDPLNPIEFTVVKVEDWQTAGVVDYLYAVTLSNDGKAEMANTAGASVTLNVDSITPEAWDATAYSNLATSGCTYFWTEDIPEDEEAFFNITPSTATALPADLKEIAATISLKQAIATKTTRNVNLFIKTASGEIIAKSVVAITVNAPAATSTQPN